jgi:dephospho-CoA kinase
VAVQELRALAGEAAGLRRLITSITDPAMRAKLAEQFAEIERKITETRKPGVFQ